MSSTKTSFITRYLDERKAQGRLRDLKMVQPILGTPYVIKDGKKLINFSSNDYLGLTGHPIVIQRSHEFLKKFGTGSGASRLVSGTLSIHEKLEKKLAAVFAVESALIFNSGFQANVGILASLADRNSLILADKKVHNSLIQGAILSRATLKRFHHNDLGHLENLLMAVESGRYNRVIVVSETVFSMDGDQADVHEIARLSKKHGAIYYSDDAHAVGVLGKKGLGLNYRVDGIDLSLATFGKAFGAFGAFVGCSEDLKNYLVNASSGFIYTTALPPAIIGAIDAALDLVPEMEAHRVDIFKNIKLFTDDVRSLGFRLGKSNSQIIPLLIGEEKETVMLSEFLEKMGIWATAIRPPTVKSGSSRIRFTITANHKPIHIRQLLEALSLWKGR